MRLALRWMMPVVLVALAMPGHAASFDQIKSLWEARQWAQVIPLVSAYRNEPGGRTWQVDYMLGTSECHVAGQEKRGEAVLNYVLQNYHLPDSGRDATSQAIAYCEHQGNGVQQEPSFLFVPITGQMVSGPLVSGKGGYLEVPESAKMITGNVTRSPIPISELEKRVYSVKEADEALAAAKARIRGSNGAVESGFVVVCGEYCDGQPKGVAECLAGYRWPLYYAFEMEVPQSLVTVYVAGDIDKVGEFASRLHSISLPFGTVAYSVYEDLSIVGMGSGDQCGSLAHELVHLSIREKFGDSPPWLEEGLASEVAVSEPTGKLLRFGPSWRDDTLREEWQYRPSVGQLIAANWSEYSANDRSSEEPVAALQAMAAVFIRYLDAKGKLKAIYFAIRDNRFPAGASAPRPAAEIVQEQMGMNLAQMDADFVRWFGESERRSWGAGNDPPEVTNQNANAPPKIKK